MKNWITTIVFAVALGAQARTVTDALGRTVTVPDRPQRVFASTKLGCTLLYTLNPAWIVAQNSLATDAELEFLSPKFLALPVLGGWFSSGTKVNLEEVLHVNPDLIVIATFLPARRELTINQVRKIEQVLRIPVVVVDGTLESLPATYRFLGTVLGETARAEQLASYAETTLVEIGERARAIPADRVVRVYYADGEDGFMTSSSGSIHTRLIDLVGGHNVSTLGNKMGGDKPNMVSPEQLLIWNPDLIIAYHDYGTEPGDSTGNRFQNDPRLKSITAVKKHQIYDAPYRPFNLMDHPPTINRLLGLKWMGHLLYPEFYPYDLPKAVAEFYRLFYRIEMSPAQAEAALGTATRR
jgi:iron complex transport system substrate-binding protein